MTIKNNPEIAKSGSELAVAGARVPFCIVTESAVVGTTAASVSALVVGVGSTPAAESTHTFMLVMRATLVESTRAFPSAATTAFTESASFVCGGMNVVNCAAATRGSAARIAIEKKRRICIV